MENHNDAVKEQLLHMLGGAICFIALGVLAVFLDLLSTYVKVLGVSTFTYTAIEWTAHVMLVLDLILFGTYLLRSSLDLFKEILK